MDVLHLQLPALSLFKVALRARARAPATNNDVDLMRENTKLPPNRFEKRIRTACCVLFGNTGGGRGGGGK